MKREEREGEEKAGCGEGRGHMAILLYASRDLPVTATISNNDSLVSIGGRRTV